jgi:hypothetical protein
MTGIHLEVTTHSEFADPAAVIAPAAGAPKWLVALEEAVGTAIEVVAALLVVAEVVILLAGVISRYVFHQPLLWTDELASILFLWLAMLGAVVALRRGEHMRMIAVVGMVSPPMRAFLDVLSIAAATCPTCGARAARRSCAACSSRCPRWLSRF